MYFKCRPSPSAFYNTMSGHVTTLWMAGINHKAMQQHMPQVTLTVPLRSPPAVTQEVGKSGSIAKGLVLPYTTSDDPLPTHGTAPITLHHTEDQRGHRDDSPHGCYQCGVEVGKEVTRLIQESQRSGQEFLLYCIV